MLSHIGSLKEIDDFSRSILGHKLHWLNVPKRIEYKLGVMVYQCLHDWAPQYLTDHLIPASDAAPRHLRLRSANLNTDFAHMAVGLFIALARQSGTRCHMNLALNDL